MKEVYSLLFILKGFANVLIPVFVLGVLVVTAVLFSTSINPSNQNFNEETYIDDIPFSTAEVYNEKIAEQNLAEFSFEEEPYIDDISINTKCISAQCLYQTAISIEFNFDVEQYIDDIEF